MTPGPMLLLAAVARRCPVEPRGAELVAVLRHPGGELAVPVRTDWLDELEAAGLVVVGETGPVATTRGAYEAARWLKAHVRAVVSSGPTPGGQCS